MSWDYGLLACKGDEKEAARQPHIQAKERTNKVGGSKEEVKREFGRLLPEEEDDLNEKQLRKKGLELMELIFVAPFFLGPAFFSPLLRSFKREF